MADNWTKDNAVGVGQPEISATTIDKQLKDGDNDSSDNQMEKKICRKLDLGDGAAKESSKALMLLCSVFFHFSASNGDSEAALRRLFSSTTPLLWKRNRRGESPIIHAFMRRNWKAASVYLDLVEQNGQEEMLLKHRTNSNQDLLMLAAASDQVEIVRRLVRLQPLAVVRNFDRAGRNCFTICTIANKPEHLSAILEELQEHDKVVEKLPGVLAVPDNKGNTAIHHMAVRNQLKMLNCLREFTVKHSLLIDWDARYPSLSLDSRTVLMSAAAEGNREVCKFLLEHKLADDLIEEEKDRKFWREILHSKPWMRLLLADYCDLVLKMLENY